MVYGGNHAEKRQYDGLLNIIFASVLGLMMIAAVGVEENSSFHVHNFDVDLSDGWSIIEPDHTRSEVTFPYHFQNDSVQIIRTLPSVPDYAVLLIKCNYNSLTAYVDGEVINKYVKPKRFGLTSGK